MDNTLVTNDKGMIQTGKDSFVNPKFMSSSGTQQAQQFAKQNQSITSEDLKPEAPLKVPQQQVPTSAGQVSGIAQGVSIQTKEMQALEREAQDKADASRSEASSSKADLQSLQQEILGVSATEQDLQKEQDIAGKSQRVTNYTNQLDNLERTELNEMRTIEETPNLSFTQKQQQKQTIQRKYAFQKADVALLQSASNRDLATAQSIIDSKINLIIEPLKLRYQFAKDFYDENKADLTAEEDKLFSLRVAKDERAYNEERNRVETLESMRLDVLRQATENNAPASVLKAITTATTPQDVLLGAGEYSGDLLAKQIKQAQLYNMQLDAKVAMKKLGEGIDSGNPLSRFQAQGNIELINGLGSNPALDSAVGTTLFSRGAGSAGGVVGRFLTGGLAGSAVGATAGLPFGGVGAIPGAIGGFLVGGVATSLQGSKDTITGQRQNFISGVEQLTSQLSLDSLIRAKANGATFGALSDSELNILSASASKLSSWAIKNDSGKVTGYNASEQEFKKELDKISNFAKIDYLIRGGQPKDIGVIVMPDNSLWAENTDGTLTQLQ